jgi:hypothetical protein
MFMCVRSCGCRFWPLTAPYMRWFSLVYSFILIFWHLIHKQQRVGSFVCLFSGWWRVVVRVECSISIFSFHSFFFIAHSQCLFLHCSSQSSVHHYFVILHCLSVLQYILMWLNSLSFIVYNFYSLSFLVFLSLFIAHFQCIFLHCSSQSSVYHFFVILHYLSVLQYRLMSLNSLSFSVSNFYSLSFSILFSLISPPFVQYSSFSVSVFQYILMWLNSLSFSVLNFYSSSSSFSFIIIYFMTVLVCFHCVFADSFSFIFVCFIHFCIGFLPIHYSFLCLLFHFYSWLFQFSHSLFSSLSFTVFGVSQ